MSNRMPGKKFSQFYGGGGSNGNVIYIGIINIPSDFPLPSPIVQIGWEYSIGTNVTDNDPTRTDTGQSFLKDQWIIWNGTNWSAVSGDEFWSDDGSSLSPIDARDVNVQSGKTFKINNVDVVRYTTTTPTTQTVGGIPAGTSFTNKQVPDLIDELLHPYSSPQFTSFALDQTSPLEVGASISGAHTFTWSTSNIDNVATNTVAIKDVTGAVVLGIGLSNSGSFAYSFPSAITLNSPGSYQWRISAIDTNSNAFGEDLFDQWMWKSYWGTSTNTSLTSAQVLALANNQLATSATGTYSFAAGGYKYFCIPTSWTQPTQFKDHATGFAIDMQAPVVLSVTNSQSIATNYNIYRSTYILTDSVQIDVA